MKRMLSLVLVLSLANVARAADDAPVVMQAGDPAPVAGVLLPNNLAVVRAQELTRLRVENQALKDAPQGVSVPVVVVLVLSGLVLGAAAGAGVVLATAPK